MYTHSIHLGAIPHLHPAYIWGPSHVYIHLGAISCRHPAYIWGPSHVYIV